MDHTTIASNTLKSAKTSEEIRVDSLWKNQACVIIFLRRFGCGYCRIAAKALSAIKPQLDANNVRLVAVGPEFVGVDEFIRGQFFSGDLYVDSDKKCYKDLNYKRYKSLLTLLPAILSKKGRAGIKRVRREAVGGDLRGDWYQIGGCLVVAKGGETCLLHSRQDNPGEYVRTSDILVALAIPTTSTDDGIKASLPTCKPVTYKSKV